MGANLTRPHERHREAPNRETRQAAPDGARTRSALCMKIRGFLVRP